MAEKKSWKGFLEYLESGEAFDPLGVIPIFGTAFASLAAGQHARQSKEEAQQIGEKAKQTIQEAEEKAGEAYDKAQEYLQQWLGKTEEINQPWLRAGLEALAKLQSQPGFRFQDFRFEFNPDEDPSFRFRLNEALNAVQQSAAAKGGLLSGATLKALEQRASNLASEEYNRAYQRALSTWKANLAKALQEYESSRQNLRDVINAGIGARNILSQAYLGTSRAAANIEAQRAGNILRGGLVGADIEKQAGLAGLEQYLRWKGQQYAQQRQFQEDIVELGGDVLGLIGGNPTKKKPKSKSSSSTGGYLQEPSLSYDSGLGNYSLGGDLKLNY